MHKKSMNDSQTFIVQIMSQGNATWQGNVLWADEQKRQNFRSILELVKMIDNALEQRSGNEGGSHDKI